MNEKEDKRYIKEIIKEYNILFPSWGPTESWDLNQFKTLENMIFESTKIDVNANTLKRFFQQRTGNPQLATRDALCRFLGYSSYTDFVIKKTKKDEFANVQIGADPAGRDFIVETQLERTQSNAVNYRKGTEHAGKGNKAYIYLIAVPFLIICGYLLYIFKIKDIYTEYLVSKIEFSASNIKGTCPLTITFSYNIPPQLLDDILIVYEEANGDTSEKKLNKHAGKVNATYIYEGEGLCYLKYKGQTLKTINVESLKVGWSVFVREERKSIFKVLPISQAFNKDGYVSLPLDSVPKEARANHLFVSYVFYKDKLVDGDDFIVEARVRNAAEDNAIPVSDVIMYLSSDKGMHGFALNEAGYAYIKFVSSEKTIKGDEYNLSKFNFDASKWHVMRMHVQKKKSEFFVDGQKIFAMDYQNPIGMANELILRFKGCGAVDYVRVLKPNQEVVYEESFD